MPFDFNKKSPKKQEGVYKRPSFLSDWKDSEDPHYWLVMGKLDYKVGDFDKVLHGPLTVKQLKEIFYKAQEHFLDMPNNLELPKKGQLFSADFVPVNRTTADIFVVFETEKDFNKQEEDLSIHKKHILKFVKEALQARQGIIEIDYGEVREMFEDDDEALQQFDDLFS